MDTHASGQMGESRLLPELTEAWPAISIYLPTGRPAADGQGDAIRFRRQLDAAAAQLEARADAGTAEHVLAPARALVDDAGFWNRLPGGLALFAAPGRFRTVPLPAAPPELVVVGRRFHVTPLLPLLAGDGRFWILALAAGRVQLFAATRDGAQPVAVPDLPASVADVAAETDATEGMNFNPVARPHLNRGAPGVVKSHGTESPEEVRKAELIEYLRRVDRALAAVTAQSPSTPLVIAAEPEALGHFRALSNLPAGALEALDVNPFALDPRALHARAWPLVAPRFGAPGAALAERIAARLGTAEPTVTLKLEEILAAAAFSRVDGLLLAAGATLWGRYDPEAGTLTAHGSPGDGDEDLCNRAAVETLAHGGSVHVLPPDQMPHGAIAAAALRF